eukprot:736184-Prymnesium_polylepis.1
MGGGAGRERSAMEPQDSAAALSLSDARRCTPVSQAAGAGVGGNGGNGGNVVDDAVRTSHAGMGVCVFVCGTTEEEAGWMCCAGPCCAIGCRWLVGPWKPGPGDKHRSRLESPRVVASAVGTCR